MDKLQFANVKLENGYEATQRLPAKKERRGGSYVWNYCDKLSRNNIRCNLCKKRMSFHGTANVITHLQRRHNISGKDEGNLQNTTNEITGKMDDDDFDENEEDGAEYNSVTKKSRRSTAMSIVWKYCTRISTNMVRCKFCKKNLSYQGTSNLQRHLHRMHRINTNGRVPKTGSDDESENSKRLDTEFIQEHCSMLENGGIKCNMCSAVFNSKEQAEIGKHLTVLHAINLAQVTDSSADTDVFRVENFDEDSRSRLGKTDEDLHERVLLTEAKITKSDVAMYNEIMEEQADLSDDEDPFDPAMLSGTAFANPLSPQSSEDSFREPSFKFTKSNKVLQKLLEERMRTETECIREKTAFYRMQKYLVALRAKKMKLELGLLKRNSQHENEYVNMQPEQT